MGRLLLGLSHGVILSRIDERSSSEHAELLKVDFTRSLCSDTETPQVTHFGYLGFIFWCMPFFVASKLWIWQHFKENTIKTC